MGLTAWFKMQRDKDKLENRIGNLEEKNVHITNTKKAMRKNLEASIKEKEQILHTRIDRVRDDNIKSYEKLEDKISDLEKKYDDNTQKILTAITKG